MTDSDPNLLDVYDALHIPRPSAPDSDNQSLTQPSPFIFVPTVTTIQVPAPDETPKLSPREWLTAQVCGPKRPITWGLPPNLGVERVIRLLADYRDYCKKETTK